MTAGTALAGTVSENQYAVSRLTLGTTYYWKVTEVNPAEPVAALLDAWMITKQLQ